MLSLKEQVSEIIFDTISPEESIQGLIASIAIKFADWKAEQVTDWYDNESTAAMYERFKKEKGL